MLVVAAYLSADLALLMLITPHSLILITVFYLITSCFAMKFWHTYRTLIDLPQQDIVSFRYEHRII